MVHWKELKAIKESGFDIEKHPEMFLGLNGKIITNDWCIFDNPYGIGYIEKNLTVSDPRVLDLMMLQWRLYSQFAPQMNGSNLLYNRDFPWYDSYELTKTYQDTNQLRTALFELFYLPSSTFSIKDQKKVFGIEAVRTGLQQAYEEYKTIADLYPNGKVQTKYLGLRSPKFFYYDWLDDRWHHGLNNTVSQFVDGWNDSNVRHGPDTITYDWINQSYGFDQFLTKNWKYWDIVKFIVGYERWNPEAGLEAYGISYTMPAVLRMAGFPVNHINIEPTPLGASSGEPAVGLPLYIAESMKKEFPNSHILFGPGDTFGLYSSGDGLIKDGIKEVYVLLGDENIYLMKKD